MRTLFAVCLAFALGFAITGCSEPGDPADIEGTWVVDPGSIDNAAFNMVRRVSDRAGRNLSDAEIEPVAKELADKIRATPMVYTIVADGRFTAVAGEDTADGTWTYSKNKLTLESPTQEKPARFLVESGHLMTLGDSPRHRNVRLVRK